MAPVSGASVMGIMSVQQQAMAVNVECIIKFNCNSLFVRCGSCIYRLNDTV